MYHEVGELSSSESGAGRERVGKNEDGCALPASRLAEIDFV